MLENAVVVDHDGQPLYWHAPDGRSAGSIQDSQALWDFIWEHRDAVAGIAHSHPGTGVPHPSREDVTTFSGIELALGRRLTWVIISEDTAAIFQRTRPDADRYAYDMIYYGTFGDPFTIRKPPWLWRLWQLSYNEDGAVQWTSGALLPTVKDARRLRDGDRAMSMKSAPDDDLVTRSAEGRVRDD